MRKFIILVTIISVLCMMSAGFAQEAKSSKFQYIGVKKCKMCHKGEKKGNIFEKWQQRGHANAYAQLASEKSKEVAKKAGVKGDPQQAKQCLSCHITGYLASADQKTETLTMEEGVSCEACHGAGSGYKSLKIMKDLNAGKLKGADYGLVNPDKSVCVTCHNPNSPTYKEFNYEEAVKKIAHPLPETTK